MLNVYDAGLALLTIPDTGLRFAVTALSTLASSRPPSSVFPIYKCLHRNRFCPYRAPHD